MFRKRLLLIQVMVVLFAFVPGCGRPAGNQAKVVLPKFASLQEAEEWCKNNLKYQNDDPWDPAPDLESVFKDGHGDCKMLAGAVHEVLKSVGQESKIVTILRKDWHMFVMYREGENWRVIDNARLKPTVFRDPDEIKTVYGVKEFVRVSDSYAEFQSWFNQEVYPRYK